MHAVFALTFHPAYFEQLGFYRVEAQQAPPDVWEAYVQPAKTLKTAHKMTAIPPEMAAKVKAAIKEKK